MSTIQTLIDEHANDPLGRGYASMSAAQFLASINARDRFRVVSRRATELGILDAFADPAEGEAAIQKLETAAAGDAVVARAMGWVKPGAPGLDMGNATVRAMLDSFVVSSVLTQTEVDTIKAIAHEPISRAQELGFDEVGLGLLKHAGLA